MFLLLCGRFTMSKYRYAVFKRGDKAFVVDLWRLRLDKLRKKIFAWVEACQSLSDDRRVKKCLITLTYDTGGTITSPSSWSPKHISVFIDRLKKRKGLQVLAYAWVVELQERGVPHYHVFMFYKGNVPYPDKSGLWLYGMSNVRFRRRSARYLTAYLRKKNQKNFSLLPSGARAYACSISDPVLDLQFKALQLPEVIRQRYLDEGPIALDDLRLPADMRSVFVGNAVTEDFAKMLRDS